MRHPLGDVATRGDAERGVARKINRATYSIRLSHSAARSMCHADFSKCRPAIQRHNRRSHRAFTFILPPRFSWSARGGARFDRPAPSTAGRSQDRSRRPGPATAGLRPSTRAALREAQKCGQRRRVARLKPVPRGLDVRTGRPGNSLGIASEGTPQGHRDGLRHVFGRQCATNAHGFSPIFTGGMFH